MKLRFTEDTLSEKPAIEQLKQLKYDYIHGDELIRIKNRRVIDWAERGDIQKEMRREIKRLLKSKRCPEDKVEPLTREIVSLARIQFKDI